MCHLDKFESETTNDVAVTFSYLKGRIFFHRRASYTGVVGLYCMGEVSKECRSRRPTYFFCSFCSLRKMSFDVSANKIRK